MDVLRAKCAEWLGEADADIPTLTLAVRGFDGGFVTSAEVEVDGRRVDSLLGGRALAVDPGTHRIRVTLPDGSRKVLEVVALQGQKNQAVRFEFAPEPEIVDPEPRGPVAPDRPVNVPAAVAFSVSGAALLAGIITGALAIDDGNDLRDRCTQPGPGCTQEEIDRGLALAHASTGTFVVAGVAGVVGLTFLFALEPDASPRSTVRLGPTGITLRF